MSICPLVDHMSIIRRSEHSLVSYGFFVVFVIFWIYLQFQQSVFTIRMLWLYKSFQQSDKIMVKVKWTEMFF